MGEFMVYELYPNKAVTKKTIAVMIINHFMKEVNAALNILSEK